MATRLPLVWRRRLAVFVGGVLGGGARIGLGAALNGGTAWPWGTFVANVSGALLLGYLLTRFLQAGSRTTLTIPLLCTGLLGSYTTFSTFSLETWRLIDGGRAGVGAIYAVASLAVGFAAAAAGIRLAERRP
jgi:CrcB protein